MMLPGGPLTTTDPSWRAAVRTSSHSAGPTAGAVVAAPVTADAGAAGAAAGAAPDGRWGGLGCPALGAREEPPGAHARQTTNTSSRPRTNPRIALSLSGPRMLPPRPNDRARPRPRGALPHRVAPIVSPTWAIHSDSRGDVDS